MASTPGINLFQTQTEVHPVVQFVMPYVRNISTVSLIVFLMIGTSILTIRLFVQNELKSVASQTNEILTRVNADAVKEGILLDLHHRITLVSNIRKVQVSFAPHLDATLSIARPPRLTSFSLGDNNQTVRITVKVSSLKEASDVVDSVMHLLTQKKIRSPLITGFAIDKNGLIAVGLSYDVIF